MLNQLLWDFSMWAIAIINCFSMKRIRNELLQVNNILADKKFMTLYTYCFSAMAILQLILAPMELSELCYVVCRKAGWALSITGAGVQVVAQVA